MRVTESTLTFLLFRLSPEVSSSVSSGTLFLHSVEVVQRIMSVDCNCFAFWVLTSKLFSCVAFGLLRVSFGGNGKRSARGIWLNVIV